MDDYGAWKAQQLDAAEEAIRRYTEQVDQLKGDLDEAWDLIDRSVEYIEIVDDDKDGTWPAVKALLAEIEEKRKPHE